MPTPLHDFSTSVLVRANEINQEEVYKLLSGLPKVEILDTPEILRVFTGVPHYAVNGVLRTQIADADVDARIETILDYFRSRNVPMMWSVSLSTRPADLDRHLQAHGLTHLTTMPGMALDLDRLPASVPLPPGAIVKEVTDQDTLAHWAEAVSEGFEMPREVIDVWASATSLAGYGEQTPLRNFIAYLDGEPVGTSTLFLGGGVAGIYSVTVVPTARRQGIGAAITVAPLRVAQQLGYRIGTLLASEMGASVYRRLGFEEHGTFALYGSEALS